ncbi:head-tail connector protein [Shinella curvata]|uniref:Head-tail connector protein n=1 Tax=Shinella curvata TaxID=1817964 RepID=A0ABT8X9I1_9HYPH|nr:head-tail connector protein [Shinella curvata]MCJ8051667.1 head-tail connector protein [Shinella curvata]MDO6120385.1 head-tail connector protein [Shinella curvata]
MWYPPKVKIPGNDPVSVAEAKRQCNVLHDDDDALLLGFISAARDYVERYCGTPLAQQTVEVKCDSFGDMARLPIAPVSDVDIEYVATDGTEQTVPDEAYELRADGLEASVVLAYGQNWPVTRPGSRIVVTAIVGYETLPASIRHAMLLWIAEAYLNRENAETPEWTAFDALLTNYRR